MKTTDIVLPKKAYKRWSPEEKHRYYTLWKKSGLKLSDFCRREGLSIATFCGWKKKLTPSGKKPLAFVSLPLPQTHPITDELIRCV